MIGKDYVAMRERRLRAEEHKLVHASTQFRARAKNQHPHDQPQQDLLTYQLWEKHVDDNWGWGLVARCHTQ